MTDLHINKRASKKNGSKVKNSLLVEYMPYMFYLCWSVYFVCYCFILHSYRSMWARWGGPDGIEA